MYNLFRLAAMIVPRMPRRLVRSLSVAIGWAAWFVARKARKQATANMIHVLGAQILQTRAGRRRLRYVVRSMFENTVRNYLEAFYLPYIEAETIVDGIQVAGQEHLTEALARGKGVLLFSAHFGPFDYLSQWLVAKGYQMTIPVEQLKDQRMLALMLKLRNSHGVQYIPLDGGSSAMRTIIQALRDNHLVLITADRAVVGQSTEVPLFGAPARLPVGPAQLARRTGAALVGAFGWRTREAHGAKIAGKFVPLSLALPQEQQTNTEVLMGGIVETLEQFIGAHPDQWVVFAPVWTGV